MKPKSSHQNLDGDFIKGDFQSLCQADAITLSLDDIAALTQPMETTEGSHASFDTSLETSSFLSGTDAMDIASETTNGTDAYDMASETTNGTASLSLPDIRSESGTPSLPDDGDFPCPQCEKRFGNRRNLTSQESLWMETFSLLKHFCWNR